MKHFFLTTILVSLLFLVGSIAADAQITINPTQGYTPLAPLPGTLAPEGSEGAGTTNISTYVGGAIKLLIALGAALAVLFAIIGGTQYVAASINPAAKVDALGKVQHALLGLTIILSSYLVLNSINPDLVNFKLELPPVTVSHSVSLSVAGSQNDASGCPTITDTSAILTSSEAQRMESGVNVIFTSSDQSVQANLTRLKQESDKLLLALPQIGASGEVTSAYRPYEYQKHLYEIYDAWVLRGLKNDARPQCAASKAVVKAEVLKHFGQNGPGLVANPDGGGAPHLTGRGVDIKVTFGSSGGSLKNFSPYGYKDINDFMVKNGIKLSWQGLDNDPVHYNLKD